MTHVKALQAEHSSQGTSEPITPGRKIERKQYVVLIEKDVPNLVLADSDFSMPDYSDGWTWKRPVTKDK